MTATRSFILTEAAATLPLVRRILADVRESRCRLQRLERELHLADLSPLDRRERDDERRECERRLEECLDEAELLGVEITGSIRCVALFPFEHQWVGPSGDGKIRRAWFVFDDAQETIEEWFFDGWPEDRRPIWPSWWEIFRPGQRRDAYRSHVPA